MPDTAHCRQCAYLARGLLFRRVQVLRCSQFRQLTAATSTAAAASAHAATTAGAPSQPSYGGAYETPAAAASRHGPARALPASLRPAPATLPSPPARIPADAAQREQWLRCANAAALSSESAARSRSRSKTIDSTCSQFIEVFPNHFKVPYLATFNRRGALRSISSFASSSARPRCSLERIVPMGQPVVCAASR